VRQCERGSKGLADPHRATIPLAGGRASGPAATDRQDRAAVEEPRSRPLGLMRGRRHRRKRHEGRHTDSMRKLSGLGANPCSRQYSGARIAVTVHHDYVALTIFLPGSFVRIRGNCALHFDPTNNRSSGRANHHAESALVSIDCRHRECELDQPVPGIAGSILCCGAQGRGAICPPISGRRTLPGNRGKAAGGCTAMSFPRRPAGAARPRSELRAKG
jgi:hypothetical protein